MSFEFDGNFVGPDYDEMLCRDIQESSNWVQDKVIFLKELNRYRHMYVELAKLLHSTRKAYTKKIRECAKKEKTLKFSLSADETRRDKYWKEKLAARENSWRLELTEVKLQMTQALENKDTGMAAALDAQRKEYNKREKAWKKRRDLKMEQKEQHFAKVVDSLQVAFDRLKKSLQKCRDENVTLSKEEKEAKEECRHFQSELLGAMDERIKMEQCAEECSSRNHLLDTERNRLEADNDSLRNQLYVTQACLAKEAAAHKYSQARVNELEEAVEEIVAAQRIQASYEFDQYDQEIQHSAHDLVQTQSALDNATSSLSQTSSAVHKQQGMLAAYRQEIAGLRNTVGTLNGLIANLTERAKLERS